MQGAMQKEEALKTMAQVPGEQINQQRGKGLYSFLFMCLLVCSLIVGGILAVYGCLYSYFPVAGSGQDDILLTDNVLIHIFMVFLIGILVWLLDRKVLSRLDRGLQEAVCKSVLAVTAVLLFAAGTILVHTSTYYPVGDQLNTTAGAYYCRNGNYEMLKPGGYVGMYQQQKGFMFLYEILFGICGDFCYGAAQQFHVIFMVLTLVSGYGFVKNVSTRAIYRIIFCILMLFCVPFMIFLPYIYGDVPSICFCMILFWAVSSYGKRFQKRYLAVACLAAALSLMCRMNTWIVLIAVAIGMVMTVIERWNYRPLAAGLCILLAAAGTIKAVDVMYEYRSGYESGIGIPSILWVAMGLQETDGKAGVYNRYQQTIFEESGFDREIAAQTGKEYIAYKLEIFKNDLPMARRFFREKMLSQWMEPLFESMEATESFDEEKPVAGWIQDLYYGGLHIVVWKGANYYQSLVYMGMLLCILGRTGRFRKSQGNSLEWIPEIAIIGGFLFSLIWENQSRYCLPYYLFMLVYVPEGILQIGSFVERLIEKIRSGKSGKSKKDTDGLRKVS